MFDIRVSLVFDFWLVDGVCAGIVPRMSSRGAQGPNGWQRVRALFEMTPSERLVVAGVLVVILVALGIRAWVLQQQRADVYQPVGVMDDVKEKR